MNGLRDTLQRRAICHSIGQIISENFANTTLITLHGSSPPNFAKRVFRAWTYKARRIAKCPFQFIRITDYGPHPAPEVVFYLVADLPVDVCRAACGEWCAGEASASPLDEDGIDRIARAVVRQHSIPSAQIWGYSGGKRKPHSCVVSCGQ